ncbi:hypothetical protein RDV89_02535 [Nocardioides zeae]|uniref:Uncharacterized protein n=1 Tax=Nocardioides imazamoxiresistens TaxID=3231893 RepID=A0ABU3PRW0_9ACTN|nr:hypothetical protein [Nocardioides zeae]MDT9591928.1 hypothetical protein [Nocardioides zeae]
MEHRSMPLAAVAHALGVAAVLVLWALALTGIGAVLGAAGSIEVALTVILMGVGQVLVWRRVDRWLRRDELTSAAV